MPPSGFSRPIRRLAHSRSAPGAVPCLIISASSLRKAITGESALDTRFRSGLVQPLRPGAFSFPIVAIEARIASSVIGWPGLGRVFLEKGSFEPIGCFSSKIALFSAESAAIGVGSIRAREARPRKPLSSILAALLAGLGAVFLP